MKDKEEKRPCRKIECAILDNKRTNRWLAERQKPLACAAEGGKKRKENEVNEKGKTDSHGGVRKASASEQHENKERPTNGERGPDQRDGKTATTATTMER